MAKPPTKPPANKPFLGEDDLAAELDAWDSMFDGLHDDKPDPAGSGMLPSEPMAWPAPVEAQKDRSAPVAMPAQLRESQQAIDPVVEHAFEAREPGQSGGVSRKWIPATTSADTFDQDPNETDFSDVGVEGGPAALGELLGRPTTAPPILFDDDDRTRVSLPAAGDATIDQPLESFADEEEVFTSASRPALPRATTPPPVDLSPVATTVAPAPVAPTAPQTPRKPAIIRRNVASSPEVKVSDSRPPNDDGAAASFDGPESNVGESTRVASLTEIEARASEARSKTPTAPPPAPLEDDYADIEMSTDDAPSAPVVAQTSSTPPARKTAFIVRREHATRPPPVGGIPDGPSVPVGDVFEMEAEERPKTPVPPEPGEPAAEDDFSDVAAAVGATDDVPLPAPEHQGTQSQRFTAPTMNPPLGTTPRGATPIPGVPITKQGTGPTVNPEAQRAADIVRETSQRAEAARAAARQDKITDAPPMAGNPTGVPLTPTTKPGVAVSSFAPPQPRRNRPPTVEDVLAELDLGDDAGQKTATDDPLAAFEDHEAVTRIAPPDAESIAAASNRPPGLMDLYPRIKTPTSVPPMGLPSSGLASPNAGPARTMMGVSPASSPGIVPTIPKRAITAVPDYIPEDVKDVEPALDLDAVSLPEQVAPLAASALDEDSAGMLAILEREITTIDESNTTAALHIEAGRLAERLGEIDSARSHYDAALLADPRATIALRGLRRIARSTGDLAEATRQLDAEIAIAGALERRPLSHYRVDLMMASGEQDMARVAVGEVLDSAPSDVRALLAQLELAFLDGRADEFGAALEQLASAVSDSELRAAVQSARASLAAHQNDGGAAATWFTAAAESDPAAIGARLGSIRNAAGQAFGEAASREMIDLARTLESTDPITAAALCVRALQWSPKAVPAAGIAVVAAPDDAIVARLASEVVVALGDPASSGDAFARWASVQGGSAAERSYASARAAELIPGRAAELWGLSLQLDPGAETPNVAADDYAAAQLRTAYVSAEQTQQAIDVDLAIANGDLERDRVRLRAAFGLIGEGKLDDAIELLAAGRKARPSSLAIAEALGEALANAQRWADRAKLFAELAADPGDQLDKDVAQLHSALAWEEAVGAAAAANPSSDPGSKPNEELQVATAAALAAWEKVLEADGARNAPAAHALAILLASRLGDRDVLADVLARAQAAERSPWALASLALRRARLYGTDDPPRSEAILRELADAQPELDDPRRTVALALAAARRKEPADAATALEERANRLGDTPEAAALRLRAAQLALDAGDAGKATALLGQVERALPSLNVVPDLLAAARRRAGDRPAAVPRHDVAQISGAPSGGDAFSRLLRDADLAASHDDGATALGLYQRALELRPDDPLAVVPLTRVATQLREPAPLTALALARLRAAEANGDTVAKAEAYEVLARIDADLRDDAGSAQIALESASQADPSRLDLVHRLERHYAAGEQLDELIRLRRAAVDQVPDSVARDKATLLVDLAALSTRDHRADGELAELFRRALACNPKHRRALLQLEAIVRRQGPSPELADLEDKIAAYFADGDARAQAAFLTRAGETLAEIGRIPDAVARFQQAVEVLPGHVYALEGWRHAALKGELWGDVSASAARQADATTDALAKGSLHHLAGVALMDKALEGSAAAPSFHRALAANPKDADSFLRLRILLEEDGNHDDLATLLAQRLEVETDERAKVELHRALAELHRNFLSDREAAKRHFRAILAADPNDLRAHSAVADIAWEQGNWEEAADALVARARLEREPEILKTLCYRLGLIYADRLVDVPMALKAFQRALTYAPDDENTLVRLADLATSAGEWKLALGACERLVKSESDPDRRAVHLQRVAKIFKQGFNDAKRAERALNLALDSAPTNDDALTALVDFYKEAGDMVSVRVHLNRVAGAMRARFEKPPAEDGQGRDGVACRVISRAMVARDQAGVPGSLAVARSAAELADLLGAAGEPERALLSSTWRPEAARLVKPETDEVLFPRGVPTELRQIFQLLGERVAKHVGTGLAQYGVSRGDRLRARDNEVAAVAQEVASALGFGEIDVYVSAKQPFVMVVEPMSPVSLILGQAIAQGSRPGVRFAAGAALKLAQASLAIPARQTPDELGVLSIALLRLFQPEFPALAVDTDAVGAQMQKLRRLIPTGLFNELRPFALAVDSQRFDHRQLARDLRVTGLRAGLVASGSLTAGLGILAAQGGIGELAAILGDPIAAGLVTFALSEDHSTVAR